MAYPSYNNECYYARSLLARRISSPLTYKSSTRHTPLSTHHNIPNIRIKYQDIPTSSSYRPRISNSRSHTLNNQHATRYQRAPI